MNVICNADKLAKKYENILNQYGKEIDELKEKREECRKSGDKKWGKYYCNCITARENYIVASITTARTLGYRVVVCHAVKITYRVEIEN